MWTRKRCPGTWSILSRFSLRPRSPGTERAVSRSRVRDCLVVVGVKQAMLLGILSTQEEEEESGSGVNIDTCSQFKYYLSVYLLLQRTSIPSSHQSP